MVHRQRQDDITGIKTHNFLARVPGSLSDIICDPFVEANLYVDLAVTPVNTEMTSREFLEIKILWYLETLFFSFPQLQSWIS